MLTPIGRPGSHSESIQMSPKVPAVIPHGVGSSSNVLSSSITDPCGLVTRLTNWLKKLILSAVGIKFGDERGVKFSRESLIQKGNEIYDRYREPEGLLFPSRICTLIRFNDKIIAMPLASLADASSISAFRNDIKMRMNEALADVSLTSGSKLSISTHFFHDRGAAEEVRYDVHYNDCSIDMRTDKQRGGGGAGPMNDSSLAAHLRSITGSDRDRLNQLTAFLAP